MQRHVRFVENYDHRITPNLIIIYIAGKEYFVPQKCAREAIKAGKAVALKDKQDDRRALY